jgi:predicted ester cyclase
VAVCLDLAATLLGLCSGHDGAPADGKPVHWDAVDIYRVTDGKISEERAVAADAATAQIGAFNPPWAA